MKYFKGPWIVLSLLALVAAGCGKEKTSETPSVGIDADSKKYKLAAEPKGSIDVIKARATTKDGDEIVIVGRIGGENPWVKGLAAFRIVDTSLKPCNQDGSENCATPWDY